MSSEPSGKAGELKHFENLEELGRRAVACKRWRWIEGMFTNDGDRIASVERDSLVVLDEEFELYELLDGDLYPDLTDPATVGCLLALVREVYPGCYAEPNGAPSWDGFDEAERNNWWRVYRFCRRRLCLIGFGPTEAAALVAALEAAP